MRGRVNLLLVALAISANAVSKDDFRVFTAADGRVIEARILEYNPSRKKIQIDRANGKKVWVEPHIFSETDREYIRDWIQASGFLVPSKVRITIDRHKKSKGKQGDDVHFSITIKNRTDMSLENLIFDYRVFIEGEGRKRHQDKDRCEAGQLKLELLAAGEQRTINTKPYRMIERYEVSTSYGTDEFGNSTSYTIEEKVWDDDDRGIWFKISGPELEGVPLVREEWYPKELKKRVAWIEAPRDQAASSGDQGKSDLVKEGEKYRTAKNFPKALEVFKQAYKETGRSWTAFKIGGIYLKNTPLQNLDLAEEWMSKTEGSARRQGFNMLAMTYVTTNKKLRDGKKAIKYALIAIEVSGEADWLLDTLACAYARNGQFDLAVKTQEKAYKMAKKSKSRDRAAGFKKRLEQFKQGKAWPN
ncbi:MAG: hypothetical protein V3V05_12600 [Pontiella sp.]